MVRYQKIAIIDGYNDEPGGLGVPPYIDVYPRYIAGSFWLVDKTVRIDYYTIDTIRGRIIPFVKKLNMYDLLVFLAGVVVPGRYIGGNPIKPEELAYFLRVIRKPLKILAGPAAKWGLGWSGGKPAYPPSYFKRAGADILVTGDVEEFFYDFALYGEERASPWRTRKNYSLVDRVAVIGSRIIKQHPNYGRNLIVELETYRGCARWISGGCSFCVEPLRGKPIQRSLESIVKEVEALYNMGARHFRLGRQADILVYGSPQLGLEEWPTPCSDCLKKLFHGIRTVAPHLETLHIDNINPGTIVRHKEESVQALKNIVLYHTPGDVAAFGLETADPKVAKINNLNVNGEEVLEAVRIVNRVGSKIGYNGMPHLLPGINFILGLPGESKETYTLNRELLESILREKLLVRRVNVRRLLPLPSTRVYRMKYGVRPRLEKHARSFLYYVRNIFEKRMLELIAPPGRIIRNLWVETCSDNVCYSRQPGSYPLTVTIKEKLQPHSFIYELIVVGIHSGRSLLGKPLVYRSL